MHWPALKHLPFGQAFVNGQAIARTVAHILKDTLYLY
jgi:hypothetical protein